MAECNILRVYSFPGLSPGRHSVTLSKLKSVSSRFTVSDLSTEICYNISVRGNCLNSDELENLMWLLNDSFGKELVRQTSFLDEVTETDNCGNVLIEIGPRLNFSTAWSTNAVSICHSIGLERIDRIERSCRYLIQLSPEDDSSQVTKEDENTFAAKLHDRMTECRYEKPLTSFEINVQTEECYEVDVLNEGRPALEKVNRHLGLAFDDWDLDYYTKLFKERVFRNPTSVECFDLAQSNSEHSRHWFFKGRLVVDGYELKDSLMKMVMRTQETSNDNSVIKFSDNSSAIKGNEVSLLLPENHGEAAKFQLKQNCTRHIIFTAETHNFPTGVAPFPGATTGTGGRIRDVQAAGRGAHVVAGTAGYCFGNLHIPGYELPWEDSKFVYPNNMAPPLEIAVEASNGASDYGNKFGEPVLAGFARSFGMMLPSGERREWVKPIMFSGGIGMIDDEGVIKLQPAKGMSVVKVGGPVYRIGVGGGAASSIQVQGDNESELDFGAVQRGDAEMEQKLNRAIRACIEMGSKNPICSIHDQGAGGNGNVLKEISEPAGAIIHVKDFILGDPTISVLELWGAEYQESNALLVHEENRHVLQSICDREKVPVSFVGQITGDGKIVLEDDTVSSSNGLLLEENGVPNKRQRITQPVDLELEVVLGKMPQKVFNLERLQSKVEPLRLGSDLTVKEMLDRVLRLPSVASKRYLTNKVDRSVTGLVAQQQCVGPLHTPVADVAVTALTYFDNVGSATAIGEQPIKGLVDPACGARMAVGEALTNLVFARITDLKDVKCSANWMWPAKLPGEGAALYDACAAMCNVMSHLGIAVDGGKDSLSMAARVGSETVKAPGSLVISVYASCPDVRATITPDLKIPDGGANLLWVKFGCDDKFRLGGSALAQVYNQLGSESPDLDDVKTFEAAFRTTQELLAQDLIMSGHDISDGGLITTILEMAFAGNCGLTVDVPCPDRFTFTVNKAADVLFAEELGIILEIKDCNTEEVVNAFCEKQVPCYQIGKANGMGKDAIVSLSVGGELVLEQSMVDLRDMWEATSFHLERLQSNPQCVKEEEAGLRKRFAPMYKLSFDPKLIVPSKKNDIHPKVAIIREEGSNGDREMVASFHMAGFETWDVTMNDLCTGAVSLEEFRGAVFVGGFSYADVLGSAKGWAAVCKINATVRAQLDAFISRSDTFSLGVCNGCQLMGLLGWVGQDVDAPNEGSLQQGVHFTHNTSERYESRFVTVAIQPSPAMMLSGMEGSTLGIWVAHGEGRIQFSSNFVLQNIMANKLVPLRYVDDEGCPTTQYPLNPNGSPEGIAGLCSPDGRHLAMMPHPERCTLLWQWPWMPLDWKNSIKASPWLKMFQNAYKWCIET
ncbi:phosphoribosylformylglycinamidine synthase-like [Montipora foliosa]|uniref:phosphoribosylformylglycinamidine synthase-like n=1 Tax=Montipora foliosa TaxID=591990 RepID=UPI0035F1AADB